MKIKILRDKMNNRTLAIARIPEPQDIEALRVDDYAPDCFGNLSRVASISHRGLDVHGRPFVCYHTALAGQSAATCSMSMKAGELIATVSLSGALTSDECQELEVEMNGAPQCRCLRALRSGYHAPTCPVAIYGNAKGL